MSPQPRRALAAILEGFSRGEATKMGRGLGTWAPGEAVGVGLPLPAGRKEGRLSREAVGLFHYLMVIVDNTQTDSSLRCTAKAGGSCHKLQERKYQLDRRKK